MVLGKIIAGTSVWYFVYVSTNHLASGSDWGYAAIDLVIWIIVALPLGTFVLLSNRDSRYAFAPEELSKLAWTLSVRVDSRTMARGRT